MLVENKIKVMSENSSEDCDVLQLLDKLNEEKKNESSIAIQRQILESIQEKLVNLYNVIKDVEQSNKVAGIILKEHLNDTLIPILTNKQTKSKNRNTVMKLLTIIVTISQSKFGRDILMKFDFSRDVLTVIGNSQSQRVKLFYLFISFLMEFDQKVIELLIQKANCLFNVIVEHLEKYDDFHITILLTKLNKNILLQRTIRKTMKIQFFDKKFIVKLLHLKKPQCAEILSEFLEILCTTNKGIAFVSQDNDIQNFNKENIILRTILVQNGKLFEHFWKNEILTNFLLKLSLRCLDLTKYILISVEKSFIESLDHFVAINQFLYNFFDNFQPFILNHEVALQKKVLLFFKNDIILKYQFNYFKSDQISNSDFKIKSYNLQLFYKILKCFENQLNQCPTRDQFIELANAKLFKTRFPDFNQILQLWQMSIEQNRNLNAIETNYDYFETILQIVDYYVKFKIVNESLFEITDAKLFLVSLDFIPNLEEEQKRKLFHKCVHIFLKISTNEFFKNNNELLIFIFEQNNYFLNLNFIKNFEIFHKFSLEIWLKYFENDLTLQLTLIDCLKNHSNIDLLTPYEFLDNFVSFIDFNTINIKNFDNVLFELYFQNFQSDFLLNYNFNEKLNLIAKKFFQYVLKKGHSLNLKKFFNKNGPQFYIDVLNRKQIDFNHLELFSNFALFYFVKFPKTDSDFFDYVYQTIRASTNNSLRLNYELLKQYFVQSLNNLLNQTHFDEFLLKFIVILFEQNNTESQLRQLLFRSLSDVNDFTIISADLNSLTLLMFLIDKIRLDLDQIIELFNKIRTSGNRLLELNFLNYILKECINTSLNFIDEHTDYFQDNLHYLLTDKQFALNLITFWIKYPNKLNNTFKKSYLKIILITFENAMPDIVVEFLCCLLQKQLLNDQDYLENIQSITTNEKLLFKLCLSSNSLQIKQLVFNKYRNAVLQLKSFLISNDLAKSTIISCLKVIDDVQFIEMFVAKHELNITNIEINTELYLKWLEINKNYNNDFVKSILKNFMKLIRNSADPNDKKTIIEYFNIILNYLLNNSSICTEIKLELLKHKLFKSYIKQFPPEDFETNPNNALVLKLIRNLVTLLLCDDQKIAFFEAFSSNLNEILLNEHLNEQIKCDYVNMLEFIIKGIEQTVLKPHYLATLLTAYNGTLTELNQALLRLIRMFEDHKIEGSQIYFRPIIWSNMAQDYYSLIQNNSRDILKMQPQMWHVMNLFDNQIVNDTIDHFPRTRDFNFEMIDSHIVVYDPAFYLTCFYNILEPDVVVNLKSFITSGALSLTLIALSSYHSNIQRKAIMVLDKFYFHLEAFTTKQGHYFHWLHFIEIILRGLNKSAKKKIIMNNICATFLAKISQILSNTLHPLYKQIGYFIGVQKSLDPFSIPAFLQLFHGTDFVVNVESQEHARFFILNVIHQGILNKADVKALFRTMVFKIIMDFYSSSLCSQACRILILEILLKSARIPLAANVLITSFGVINWIHFELEYFNNIDEDISQQTHEQSSVLFSSTNKTLSTLLMKLLNTFLQFQNVEESTK